MTKAKETKQPKKIKIAFVQADDLDDAMLEKKLAKKSKK